MALEEVSTDADGRSFHVFKDGEGRILGTTRGTSDTWASMPTYYIYDSHDRLRAVAGSGIAFTDTLKMWRYGYDSKNRLSSKGIPGAAREGYGYDSENRLVRVRFPDGGLKRLHYDAMYRVDSISFTPSGGVPFPLERHYFDSEPTWAATLMTAAGEGAQWTVSEKGLETGRMMALLDSSGTADGYALTAIRYDDKSRPVCMVTQWPDSTLVKENLTYNFPGDVISQATTIWHGADVDILSLTHAYDIRGRETSTTTSLSHNGVTVSSDVTSYEYDDLGRLSNTISTAGGTQQQLRKAYSYTLQGFSKTLSTQFGSDSLYVETLAYDDPDTVTGLSGISASYSGFITGKRETWPIATSPFYSNAEAYGYDVSGRLTGVVRENESQQFSYDPRGNILSAHGNTYTYSGDRLTGLTSANNDTYSFSYDTKGRMTSDGLASTSISYNVLDLPRKITSNNGDVLVNYSYLADGSKVEALKADGSGLVYRGSLIYRKAADGTLTLESAQIPEGRLLTNGVRYHVTDHLGSVVAVVDGITGAVYQANEYAPYGERADNTAVPTSSAPTGETFREQFTGKESQALDFTAPYLDFGARHYSPSLSRWLAPDPLSEKYYDISPYAYCDGNPVMLVDEDGRDFRKKRRFKTIIISADYYVEDELSYKSAILGTNFWNKRRDDKYFDKKSGLVYDIQYNLTVTRSNFRVDKKRHENTFSVNNTHVSNGSAGTTRNSNDISVRPEYSYKLPDGSYSLTPAHEIGHTLGMKDQDEKGIMFRAQGDKKVPIVTSENIEQMIYSKVGGIMQVDIRTRIYEAFKSIFSD